MELFLELASTIALTLLLCYTISKLVSSSPKGDTQRGDRKIGVHECKFGAESAVRDTGIGERFEVVEKVEGEEQLEDFAVEEFVNGCFSSREIRQGSKIEAHENEASEERLDEQESYGENGGFSEIEKENIGEIEVCLSNNDEISVSQCKYEEKREYCVEEEDDWVGIERTELERLLGEALVFVGSKSNSSKVSGLGERFKNEVVRASQNCNPRTLLGTPANGFESLRKSEMERLAATPEKAMEQYILLLTENVPGWMRHGFANT